MRKNLVTVPACDEHNAGYKKDDEVASYVVLLTERVNRMGQEQLTKLLRAIRGRKGLVASIFKNIEVIQLPDGSEIPKIQFDAERVNRVMERIARGLFFHDFGRRWRCEFRVLAHGPLMSDLSPSPYAQRIRRLQTLFIHSPRKSEYPEVFWYQWVAGVGGDSTHLLRMCFYNGLTYYVESLSEGHTEESLSK